MQIRELISKNTNKTKGIEVGDDFTVIIIEGDSKEEVVFKVYDFLESGTFRIRKKEACYIGNDNQDKYYETLRVQTNKGVYDIISGFYFYIIKPDGYEGPVLRGVIEDMLSNGKLNDITLETA